MKWMNFYPGKVVVITGSARGIGREAARQALAAGALVVVNGRDPEAVRETAHSFGKVDRTLAVAADVSTPEGARHLVAETLGAWGRIDVLINNAGLSMRGTFADLDPITVRTMVEANLLTAVWTTQAALPALRESHGRILFVSSLAGVRGFPGVSLYSASKMALGALCQSVRAEEGSRGVRAGLILLAFTENDPAKTVLGADGRPFRHERQASMSQDAAAQALLRASARANPRTVLTLSGKLLVRAEGWFPGLTDRVLGLWGGRTHTVRVKS
jgi:NAD(P)-dependent dehydrogenase (short-subunit alcohol dehydrogenase family)